MDKQQIKISQKEKLFLLLESIGVTILLTYFFYRNWWAFVPMSLLGVFFFKCEKKDLLGKKKEEIRQQFKELLFLAMSAQKAGYSIENAFLDSYDDLKNLFGKDSYICCMLAQMRIGIENHISMTELWKRAGEISNIVEIQEFATIFEIAKKSGGNMTEMLENTAQAIANKTETKKEIAIITAAGKLEMKIMNSMPFAILFYVDLMYPGYFNEMYVSKEGIIVMTVCLGIYVVAYQIGRRMITVEF